MTFFTSQFLFSAEAIIFATIIFMHLLKKNYSAVNLYIIQSLMVTLLLFSAALPKLDISIILVIILIFITKVIVAPYFFYRLIKKNRLIFSVSNYLNTPLTLIIITVLAAITRADFLRPLALLAPDNERAILLALAAILIAIFLIINRRGALSQMLGILSLENSIVSFAALAGLEQAAGVELGLTFNIFTWIVIASVFVSMIYRQFGSLDVTLMANLKE